MCVMVLNRCRVKLLFSLTDSSDLKSSDGNLIIIVKLPAGLLLLDTSGKQEVTHTVPGSSKHFMVSIFCCVTPILQPVSL